MDTLTRSTTSTPIRYTTNLCPQYSCFVEGCERKCRTPQKRRMHLIDKHMYPKNFFFAITKEGIDGRRSLLVESGHHRRKSSSGFTATKDQRRRASLIEAGSSTSSTPHKQNVARDTDAGPSSSDKSADTKPQEEESDDGDMAELTGAMSSLQFVPSSIRFGRGGRPGFSKR